MSNSNFILGFSFGYCLNCEPGRFGIFLFTIEAFPCAVLVTTNLRHARIKFLYNFKLTIQGQECVAYVHMSTLHHKMVPHGIAVG